MARVGIASGSKILFRGERMIALAQSGWLAPLAGLLAGAAMGYVARRWRLCALSALERWWYAGDATALRAWVLAMAVAMALTQAMVLTGAVDLSTTFYLSALFPLTGAVLGGLMFGVGMALVGSCGFSALVRLGGGSLKAAVVLMIMGLSALAAQKGIVAHGRILVVDDLAVDLSHAGDQSLGALVSAALGADLRAPVAFALVASLFAWVLRSPVFRARRGLMLAGSVIGVAIASGWAVTSFVAENSFTPVQIEAGSFAVPLGDTIMQVIAHTGALPDYGVGVVAGVALGAAVAAWGAHDLRWEACDDARELGRHMAGAALMGVGGVFAMGCTIGQGVTAASTLAISAPIVMASMALGARLGLAWLIEGSVRHVFLRAGDRAPAE
jgi:uncharacterized membrane protein YedE/YeeE